MNDEINQRLDRLEKKIDDGRRIPWLLTAGTLVAGSLIDSTIDETKIVPKAIEICREACDDGVDMVNRVCDYWPQEPYSPHDSDPCLPGTPMYFNYASTTTTTTTTTTPDPHDYHGPGDDDNWGYFNYGSMYVQCPGDEDGRSDPTHLA